MAWYGWLYFAMGLAWVGFRYGYRRMSKLPPDTAAEVGFQFALWLPLMLWAIGTATGKTLWERSKK